MKRLFTCILALFAVTPLLNAQSFKFVDDISYAKKVWVAETTNDIHADVVNLTAMPLALSWKLISSDLTLDSVSICDNFNCYKGSETQQASSPVALAPNEPTTFLKVQIPTYLPTKGIIKYLIYATNEGELSGREFTFELVEEASSVSDVVVLNSVVTPNPVESSFTIKGYANYRLSVYDINGVVVKEVSSISDAQTIYTNDLASGVYNVQLVHGNRLINTRFVKQ